MAGPAAPSVGRIVNTNDTATRTRQSGGTQATLGCVPKMLEIPHAIQLSANDLGGWSEDAPWIVQFLKVWSRMAPRMKAALPSFIGRRLLHNHRFVLRANSGARYAVYPADLGTYFAMLNGGVRYPSHVLDVCRAQLRPGDVFYDVGANVGHVSIQIGYHFRGAVDIVSFEPQPNLAYQLAVSAALNGVPAFQVFDVLLGDHEGGAELFLTQTSAHASLVARDPTAKPLPRQMSTIDGLIGAAVIRPPSVVKIDVEGAEMQVLKGARHMLKVHRPLLVLEADSNMGRFGYNKEDLFLFLRSTGDYRFFDIACGADGRLSRLIPLRDAGESHHDDILATPSDRVPLLLA
jgi:FkbM family methyltransferase